MFRQYRLGLFDEPRVHCLLGEEEGCGYRYHGVSMKATSVQKVPTVEKFAHASAREFLQGKYQMDRWNVGMDMIVYRDGQDSCGWHADDTQNECLVVAVVVECGSARRVCIRPNRKPSTGAKRAGPLEEGDEEIELHVGQGGEGGSE